MRLSCRRLEIGGLCFAGRGVHCRHDCLLWIKALPACLPTATGANALRHGMAASQKRGGGPEAAALLLSLARVSEIDDGFRGSLAMSFFLSRG